MQLLHLHWQPYDALSSAGYLVIWAEDGASLPKRSRSNKHPFAAVTPELHALLQTLDLDQPFSRSRTFALSLPTGSLGPLPSPGLTHAQNLPDEATPPTEEIWQIPGVSLSTRQGWTLLVSQLNELALPAGLGWGQDFRFWLAAAGLALRILSREEFKLNRLGRVGNWSFLKAPHHTAQMAQLQAAMPPLCRHNLDDPGGHHQPEALLQSFLRAMIGELAGAWYQIPYSGLTGFLRDKAYQILLSNIRSGYQVEDDGPPHLYHLHRHYNRWYQAHTGLNDDAFQFALRLTAPETSPASAAEARWPLEFALQSRTDPGLILTAAQLWRGNLLGRLLGRPDISQKHLLTALRDAALFFAPLQSALTTAAPTSVTLTPAQAFHFLREAAPILQAAGVKVLIPQWWTTQPARLKAHLKMTTAGDTSAGGTLTFDRMVRYRWEVSVGETALTQAEFEALVALKSPLVYLENRWVHLEAKQVEAAARFWETNPAAAELPLLEGLRFALSLDGSLGEVDIAEITYDEWLAGPMAHLTGDKKLTPLPAPAGLQGQLRHYQEYGFAWLDFMRRCGLGACLADDMGLGKTLQTLVMLLREKEERGRLPGPVLLVCPTSVTANWAHETHHFTPGLSTLLHQGPNRLQGQEFAARAAQVDLVITSYTLVHLDARTMHALDWFGVILDEAQNIKNPTAKRTKAIRHLSAQFRLALTGTPVENRLSELWSMMNFLNPGYLGPLKTFRTEFAGPIERQQDAEATTRLRRLTAPFILRRLKTDPAVIQDLPEKNEMKVYCPLSEEQASLYQAVVQHSLAEIEQADGIKRKGMVLSTLLKLKQVCNYPGQYLHQLDAAAPDLAGEAKRSGKLSRLGAMLEEANSIGDRSLIFTQFVEMGRFLQTWLAQSLDVPVLFLHGGVPAQKRTALIRQFQDDSAGPPIFILSLKAGGTGLNLTRANHVFHFDRWWNPAVEDQATDRAFRIGQRRDVQVHKFICAGTLEEMIDEMIERKKGLAESVVGGGEGWLTELSTADLRNLVSLRPEAGE
jgi:superfamily II DNA or RNA helicase